MDIIYLDISKYPGSCTALLCVIIWHLQSIFAQKYQSTKIVLESRFLCKNSCFIFSYMKWKNNLYNPPHLNELGNRISLFLYTSTNDMTSYISTFIIQFHKLLFFILWISWVKGEEIITTCFLTNNKSTKKLIVTLKYLL